MLSTESLVGPPPVVSTWFVAFLFPSPIMILSYVNIHMILYPSSSMSIPFLLHTAHSTMHFHGQTLTLSTSAVAPNCLMDL